MTAKPGAAPRLDHLHIMSKRAHEDDADAPSKRLKRYVRSVILDPALT